VTETVPQMPFLTCAATVELENLGPLEEATGEPMRASWQIHETIRKVYVLF
jgi:hypothetical protein